MAKHYTIPLKVLIAYHLIQFELGISVILAKGDAVYDINLDSTSSSVSGGRIIAHCNGQIYYFSPDRFVKCEGSMLRAYWASWKSKGEKRFALHLS